MLEQLEGTTPEEKEYYSKAIKPLMEWLVWYMNLKDYKKVKLLDLVDIERAKKNKVYEKGNIIIQVSASKGQIFYLEEDTTVESQYIILTCKNNKIINTKYLYYVINDLLPKFLAKYQQYMIHWYLS